MLSVQNCKVNRADGLGASIVKGVLPVINVSWRRGRASTATIKESCSSSATGLQILGGVSGAGDQA